MGMATAGTEKDSRLRVTPNNRLGRARPLLQPNGEMHNGPSKFTEANFTKQVHRSCVPGFSTLISHAANQLVTKSYASNLTSNLALTCR